MIHTAISHEILKYLTGKSKTLSITSSGNGCWIGFSSETPNLDGSNFVEPDPEMYPSYARVRLNLWDSAVTNYVDLWGAVGKDAEGTTTKLGCVTNDKEFTTAECKEDGGWPQFTHFGLFASEKGGLPMASDLLTDPDGEFDEVTQRYPAKTLTVGKGEVAVFRKGCLELRFT